MNDTDIKSFKIKVQTWFNVLALKRFTMQHILSLVEPSPNEWKKRTTENEVERLIKDDYLTKEGKLYKLTSDIDKRLYLLGLARESQIKIWRERDE